MHTRRQLASFSALAVFVVLAFGSEASEDYDDYDFDEALDEAIEDAGSSAPAPAAKGGEGSCAPWSGTGTPVSSIEDLFDASKLQSMGRKLDMNVECYDIDEYDGNKELDCDFWNEQWAFDIEVSKFRSSQDAKWQVEDPWVGEAYAREGNWVLGVDAENGSCAKSIMDAVIPKNTALKNFDEAKIVKGIKGQGWAIADGGCSMEKYDGDLSFDCPMENGKSLEGSILALLRDRRWQPDRRGARAGQRLLLPAPGLRLRLLQRGRHRLGPGHAEGPADSVAFAPTVTPGSPPAAREAG